MVDSVGARGSVPTNDRRQQALANGERACDRMPLHQQSNVNEKCLLDKATRAPKPGFYAYQNLCAVMDGRYLPVEVPHTITVKEVWSESVSGLSSLVRVAEADSAAQLPGPASKPQLVKTIGVS